MRALVATPELIEQELPTPKLRPHDLLVRVEAVAVNPVDTKVRAGVAPGGPPRLLGWDGCGVRMGNGQPPRGDPVVMLVYDLV